jgi:hypothetical protein
MLHMKPKRDDAGSSGMHGRPDDATRMAECLKLLRERFPHLRSLSLQLLERDETFRELCEEHAACTEALERLMRSGTDEAMRREYSALRLRIEGELLSHLSQHTDAGRQR